MPPPHDALVCDDVDEIYTSADPTGRGSWSNSIGAHSACRHDCGDSPGIHIHSWAYGARLIGREVRKDGNLSLFLRLDAGPDALVNGRLFRQHSVAIRAPHEECEFLIPRHGRAIEVQIAAHLAVPLGWRDVSTTSNDIDPRLGAELTTAVMRVATVLDRTYQPGRDVLMALQQGLLPYIDACFGGPSTFAEPPSSARLVSEASRWLRVRPIHEKLRIEDLARRIGTSERGLYASFQQWVGMGPYELDLLIRLYRLRRALLQAAPRVPSVGTMGRAFGFNDHSRMTRMYKREFGEPPSATLRRAHTVHSAR